MIAEPIYKSRSYLLSFILHSIIIVEMEPNNNH